MDSLELFFQQQVAPYTNALLQLIQPYYSLIDSQFQKITQQIHFGWFCIIYSILLLFILNKLCSRKWHPKNKQLKSWNEYFKEKKFNILLSLPFLGSYINNKFQKTLSAEEKKTIVELQKNWDPKKCNHMPQDGMTEDHLKKRINDWIKKQSDIWGTGKVSGAFYVQEQEHMEAMNDFAAPYLYQNPLHLGTYKQLNKMQNEVLAMTADLLTDSNKKYYGSITSGGSESLILALYAYRKFYSSRKRPNIVVPVTVHAAVDKGCFYLNIEARKARLNANYEVDVKHMESLIDSNTILLIGSAPNFPHGIVDPIDKLAKLALKYKVGLHVDGCLGGFVGLFDENLKKLYSLDREGVTSVSIDHHKFGLAPKGISTIFYKTQELRHHQYFCETEWPGGLYETATIPGSRPGFASAAAWYSLTQVTKKGFKQNTKQIIDATISCASKLRQIPNIQVFGEPKICVVSFTIKNLDISPLALSDYLCRQKKWNISPIHKPYGIHVSVTLANCEAVKNELSLHVKEGLEYLKQNKIKQTIASAFYGASAKIPTDSMQLQALKYLLSASMK